MVGDQTVQKKQVVRCYILVTVGDKPLTRYLQFMFDFSCETDSALEEDFQQRIQVLEEVRVTRHNLCFLNIFFYFLFVCFFNVSLAKMFQMIPATFKTQVLY